MEYKKKQEAHFEYLQEFYGPNPHIPLPSFWPQVVDLPFGAWRLIFDSLWEDIGLVLLLRQVCKPMYSKVHGHIEDLYNNYKVDWPY